MPGGSGRPASAMADFVPTTNAQGEKESWLKRNFIGRTPSLPSSLGKKKHSFLKKFHCRKISAPSFASNLKQPSQQQPPNHSAAQNEVDKLKRDHDAFDFTSCKCDSRTIIYGPLSSDLNIASFEEALTVIESLRSKYHCLGQQTVDYRHKLRQQKVEMGLMEAEHKKQLEDISAQLMFFEASLRAKERLIEKTISTKDQVIHKQQKVIKKLLKKRGEGQEGLEDYRVVPKIITNDSESIEDNTGEVSIPVPDLKLGRQDAVAASEKAKNEDQSQKPKMKTKEERRISNRQKLLSLKRHSGFLKRPEILETVYSVEEDAENNAQQQIQQQQQLQQQKKAERENYIVRKGSPGPLRRASSDLVFLIRKRHDSDMTTYSDCSTDDESTRLVFSETESECSRRSSTGGSLCCQSAPASRRSSGGSTNRFMLNHSSMIKHKDLKLSNHSAKSRSLEELLMGRLKDPTSMSSSANEDDLEEDEASSSGASANRLRRMMKFHQRSLSLDQESTDVSTTN